MHYWLLSLSRVSVAPDSQFATVVDRPSPVLAIPVLLVFSAACIAAAAWRARHIQISYGASE